MIKTVVIEDEPFALSLVEGFVNEDNRLELVGSFSNPVEGLSFVQENQVDLVLLDINMPDINGIEVAKHIHKKVKIIFTTAYKDFAFEGFKLSAVDYLLKPFDFKEFQRSIDKLEKLIIADKMIDKNEESIQIKADHKQYTIKLNDILFIENMKNYVIFRLENGEKIMALMSLKSLGESLPQHFLKIHRSYIINSDKISSSSPSEIMINEHSIPISESNRKWFKEWMGNKAMN